MKKIRHILILAGLCLLVACSQQVDEAALLEKARHYIEANQPGNAAIELKNLLQARPKNAEARFLLGRISVQLGNAAAAEKEFRRALQAGWPADQAIPALLRARVQLRKFDEVLADDSKTDSWPGAARASRLALQASALIGKQDLKAAAQRLAQAEAIDETAYDVYRARLQLQIVNKQFEAAEKTAAAALQAYPDDPALLRLQAVLEAQSGKPEAAIASYRRVIETAPTGIVTADMRAAHIGLVKLGVLVHDFKLAEQSVQALKQAGIDDPEVHYVEALLAYEKKDYDGAATALQQVLKAAPNHAPSQLLMGASNYARKDFEQAVYYLSRYVANNPANAEARKMLGRAYLALGQYDDARRLFDSLLDDRPDDAELVALKGLTELGGGKVNRGVKELERALKLAPKSNALRQQLARAYIAQGQTEQAVSQLDAMAEQGGDAMQVRFLKVYAYLKDGKIEMARKTAEKMRAAAPDNPEVDNLIGTIEMLDGHSDRAREAFSHALRLQPDNFGALRSLARLDEAEGHFDAAAKRYQAILDKQGDDVRVMLELARLAGLQKDVDGQVQWLQRARKADPKDLPSRLALAELLIRQNKLARAEAVIREIEQNHADAPALLAVKGRLYMRQKRYTQADSVFNKLIAALPEKDAGYYLQAQNMLKRGNAGEALKLLRKAYSLNPDSVRNAILLAKVELASDNPTAARILADKVIKAVPDAAPGYLLKGDSLLAEKRYREAARVFDAGWAVAPERELALRRFRVARRMHQGDKAYAILEGWMQKHPDDDRVALELATAYQMDGEFDKAIGYYEQVVRAQPDNAVALNNLAWMYGEKGDRRALDIARRAWKLNSASPGIMDTLGWIMLNQGASGEQRQQALRLLKTAAEKLPDVADVQYHYAMALIKNGDRAEGRKRLQKLVDSSMQFEGRAQALEWLKQ